MADVTARMRVGFIIKATPPAGAPSFLVCRNNGTYFWAHEIDRACRFETQDEAFTVLAGSPCPYPLEELHLAHLTVERKLWLTD